MALDTIEIARLEIAKIYIAAFNRVPDSAGLNNWMNQYNAGLMSYEEIAADFANQAEYQAAYPAYMTDSEYITAIYNNVFGRTPDAEGLQNWINQIANPDVSGITRGSVMQVMLVAADATGNTDGMRLDNQATFAVQSILDGVSTDTATAQLANITSVASTVTTAIAAVAASVNVGQTFTLTTSVDSGAAFVGTTGADTFNANLIINPTNGIADIETLGALDVIDGGAGIDTLNYFTVGGDALAGTITNIENINVRSDGAVTANVQTATGVTAVSGYATAGAVDVKTSANATSVTITGTATTVAVNDYATTDTLTTVSVTGNTGNVTIGGLSSTDSLTTLNLTNTVDGNATVTAAAGTRALTVNLSGVTGPGDNVIITDDTATTLNVNTVTTASTAIDLQADVATTVAINADVALTVAAIDASLATAITIAGDSLVTFTTNTAADLGALTSVSSANSTGGVTLTTALATGVAFTGGAGTDTVTVAGTTKAIAMGAGDDSVTMSVAVGTGGSVDAGAGTDTLVLTAAQVTSLDDDATFEAGISNFEKLSMGLSATTVASTANMANMDDINYLISAGVTAGVGSSLTVTGFAANGTFEQTGVIGGASSIALASSGGSADVLNIRLNGANQIVNTAALTVSNVEVINITATDSGVDTVALNNPSAASTILLAAANATTITVAGNHGVDFTGSTLTAVTSLDASGVVSLGDAAGATAATIQTVGAVTFSSVIANAAVTVTTGNGADVISTASVNDATFLATNVTASTISTGAGEDVITGSAGKDVINAGAGNDTITAGAAADTVTTGTGNDKITFAASTDSTLAAMDVITDFVANTYGQGTAGAVDANGANATVANWTGDVLDFDTVTSMTTIAYTTVTNAADATVFLQNSGTATATVMGAALDSTTGKLYVDLNSDGTADMVVGLTGVTSLTLAAFGDLS